MERVECESGATFVGRLRRLKGCAPESVRNLPEPPNLAMDSNHELRHTMTPMSATQAVFWRRIAAIAALGWTLAWPARGELAEDFEQKIRPLMGKKCFDCHNAEKPRAISTWSGLPASTRSPRNAISGRMYWKRCRRTKCHPKSRVN